MTPSYRFYANASPSRASYGSVLFGVGVLAVVIGAVWRAAESRHRMIRVAGSIIVFALLLLAGNVVVEELVITFPARLWTVQAALYFALYASFVVLFLALRGRFFRAAEVTLLVLVPFAVLTIGQGIWNAFGAGPVPYGAGARAALLESRSDQPRVVWVVFDEMDLRLTFEARPRDLRLPELDRLRGEALFADHALPPAPWTHISMPSLLLGWSPDLIVPTGKDDMRVLVDGAWVRWSEQGNVFHRARGLGVNTAAVGSFIPLCRLLRDSVNVCARPHSGLRDYWSESSFAHGLFTQAWILARSVPGLKESGRAEALFRVWPKFKPQTLRGYQLIQPQALEVVADSRLGLVLVHYPIPHPPAIYDRKSGGFSLAGNVGYLDNLVLSDRAIGELRRALEEGGLWDSTTLIVSSDHSFRTFLWKKWSPNEMTGLDGGYDERVPFLLKLAGQTEPLTYSRQVNTGITADLLMAVLQGDLRTPDEAAAWLDQQPVEEADARSGQ